MRRPLSIAHRVGLWIRHLVLDGLALGALYGLVIMLVGCQPAQATVVLAPNRAMDRAVACRVDPARPTTCTVGSRRYDVPATYARDVRRLNRWPVYILIDGRGGR